MRLPEVVLGLGRNVFHLEEEPEASVLEAHRRRRIDAQNRVRDIIESDSQRQRFVSCQEARDAHQLLALAQRERLSAARRAVLLNHLVIPLPRRIF